MENEKIDIDSNFMLFLLQLENIKSLGYDWLYYDLNVANFQKAIKLNFFKEISIKTNDHYYNLFQIDKNLNCLDFSTEITKNIPTDNSNSIISFISDDTIIKEYYNKYFLLWEQWKINTPVNSYNQSFQKKQLIKLLLIQSEKYNSQNLDYYFMEHDILTTDIFLLFYNNWYLKLNNIEKFHDQYISYSITNLFFETFWNKKIINKENINFKIIDIFLKDKYIVIEKNNNESYDILLTKTENFIIRDLFNCKTLYLWEKLSRKWEWISFDNLYKISKCVSESAFRTLISKFRLKLNKNWIKHNLRTYNWIIYFDLFIK